VPTRYPDKSDAPELVLEKALASLSEVPYIIVRAAESQPPSVWMVNVESQGKYCAPSRTIELWRENANRRQTLFITPRRGKRQKRKWPAKKHVYAFTFQEGVTYTINLARHPTRNFTFYQVPARIRFTHRRVTWMAKTGCVSQAKILFPW